MIRDVVIHLLNEQPVMADLLDEPTAADRNLICTNLRTMSGQRPVFIDKVESVFVFPYAHVRFIEIHPERPDEDGEAGRPAPGESARPGGADDDEIDEDFLRRIREA